MCLLETNREFAANTEFTPCTYNHDNEFIQTCYSSYVLFGHCFVFEENKA